jgi:hypothetical protein
MGVPQRVEHSLVGAGTPPRDRVALISSSRYDFTKIVVCGHAKLPLPSHGVQVLLILI